MWDSTVTLVTASGCMTDPMCRRFSVLQSVQAGCGAHLACYSVGFGSSSHGLEADCSPLFCA